MESIKLITKIIIVIIGSNILATTLFVIVRYEFLEPESNRGEILIIKTIENK